MRPKDATVKLDNLHPDMRVALDALDRAAREFGLTEAVITSGQDGQHGAGSKHHADNLAIPGEAVDTRVVTILELFAARVRRILEQEKSKTFDVVLELTPTVCPKCQARLKGTHVHVERDPK